MSLAPIRWYDLWDLVISHVGQATQHIPELMVRTESVPAASFDQGVNDYASLAGVSFPHEQPIYLADGRGPNRIFHEVVIDLHPAVGQIELDTPTTARVVPMKIKRQAGFSVTNTPRTVKSSPTQTKQPTACPPRTDFPVNQTWLWSFSLPPGS